jgi:molybdate transport system ATP-binding protein
LTREESPAVVVRVSRKVHAGLTLDVDFALARESTILFGASGAGKTTLLRLIAGLDRPDRGVVRVGEDVVFDAERRIRRPLRSRRVGMIFQDDLLFPHRNVAGNIRFGLARWARNEANARVAEVAALCGIGALLGRMPATLSGGERQRVGLARALAPRPRLLLCDEPVSALDLDSRFALLARLRAVQEAEAIPILSVTHGVDEALAFGSRLLLLDGGRIAADGPPLDVLTRSRVDGTAIRWSGFRNVFAATVEAHLDDDSATRVRLRDGPLLIISLVGAPPGTMITLEVGADEILLARGPIVGLSARNLLEGTVIRVVEHGREAEVMVRTGGLIWVVGVVHAAVESLGLKAGVEVWMIIKARSCRVLGGVRG